MKKADEPSPENAFSKMRNAASNFADATSKNASKFADKTSKHASKLADKIKPKTNQEKLLNI